VTQFVPLRVRRAEPTELEPAVPVDVRGLEDALRRRVRGEVRFDAGSRALYANDASNYRQLPLGVVLPSDVDDVVAAIDAARSFGAPIVARGGGTAIPGQSSNVALMLDFSKYMHHVLDIDAGHRLARVEPGCNLDTLREAAERHGITFGPDPATHSRNTLGGMIGNNSCGVHSVMSEFYGPGPRTSDNVESLEILTYDGLRMRVGATSDDELARIVAGGGRRGEIYAALASLRDRYAPLIRERYPRIPRRVSGYNLDDLLPEHGFNVARALVGTECTCVTVLEATVLLMENPRDRALVVLGYHDVFEAADHVPEIRDFRPIALEGMDDGFIDDMKRKGLTPKNLDLMPEGRGWLLVEFGGASRDEARANAQHMMDALRARKGAPSMKLFDDPAQERHVWHLREEGLGATAHVPGEKDNHEGWEDSAVPVDKVGAYMRDLRALMNKYDYHGVLYGHLGQGCVHTRIDFDLETRDGIAAFESFLHEAAHLVVGYGGSLSGEHGDGQARGELLPIMFGDELMEAFREFKAIWDPSWKMNPGKVVNAFRASQNLRLGTHYTPSEPETHFKFPDDHGSFAHAANRCVGAGVCRRAGGGTMCPSYMVTREEEHCTRGRSRLLFEMMQGQELDHGWREHAVRDALDLCLACKGCKRDCPVHVDMATYKAEFLSHYYHHRLRPMPAYAMGLIHWWARAASHASGLVNWITHTEPVAGLFKRLGGIAPERTVPTFAREPFTRWFRDRERWRERQHVADGHPRVILWPDTFNNFFFPDTLKDATSVLEAAGFHVEIPKATLCCGRPLYDWGMLDTAERLLHRILDTMRTEIEDGVPVVGLEPSCVAVFRDELCALMPADASAKRLSAQSMLLSEFLERHAPSFALPELHRRALVHGHCHHKSIMTMSAEESVLRRLGMDFEVLDSGCCGMAGAFGFERDHYDVSVRAGERVLLPAVRAASDDTLIVADGFSCREQIVQQTGREPVHLAHVLRMALDARAAGDAPPPA
jgi:FAD/FMN-containing dehydrogenase/Fe-S oxidoreductase